MLIGVGLYFLLMVTVLALLFFAPARATLMGLVRGYVRRGRSARLAAGRSVDAGHRWAHVAGNGASETAGQIIHWLSRHLTLCLVAMGLLVGVPLAAIGLRVAFPVSSYDHTYSRPIDAQVARLLEGERLVPPPPLPPTSFTTAEVEQARPMTSTANRQWELLDEGFRNRLLLAFKLMREQHGYEPVLLEGYRSAQRQATLAALGPAVTQAGPGESLHQQGLAADCAFLRDGKIVISEKDPWAMRGYERFGEVARTLGLTWGGDWRSLKDYGHVEWRRSPMPAHSPTGTAGQ